ncbi:MAG: hypothetical protein H7Y61_19700 [Rhizobiales bacterium]|nr:hypothetical protein [Rhizobacter sp.]
MNHVTRTLALLIGLIGAGACAPSFADAQTHQDPFGDPRLAVDDTVLGAVRGGFSVGGLSISFGIESAVFVNGALVASTTLKAVELGRVGATAASFDAKAITLVQSGAGNSIAAGAISASSLGTVVQNTLDGQKIENVTVINASANSLGLLRGFNLQSSLRGAVIDSLRR